MEELAMLQDVRRFVRPATTRVEPTEETKMLFDSRFAAHWRDRRTPQRWNGICWGIDDRIAGR